jgi:hypothetical protein
MVGRTPLCLVALTVVAMVTGPSLCIADEPPRSPDTMCPSDNVLLRPLMILLPTWVFCAISEEDNPVGSDLPKALTGQEAWSRTQADERYSSDDGETHRVLVAPLAPSEDGNKTTRSGVTNIGKL